MDDELEPMESYEFAYVSDHPVSGTGHIHRISRHSLQTHSSNYNSFSSLNAGSLLVGQALTRDYHSALAQGATSLQTAVLSQYFAPLGLYSPYQRTPGIMGNAHGAITLDGQQYSASKVKQIMIQLKEEIDQLQNNNQGLRTELSKRDQDVKVKDSEISCLKQEVDKLRSVLQQKVNGGKPDILATIQEESLNVPTRKKQGVSGESLVHEDAIQVKLSHHDKDFGSKTLIKHALKQNDFLKNMDKSQVWEIINCMYEQRVPRGDYIIKENEEGNHLYVLAEGTLEVLKNDQSFGVMHSGRAFGELAILYGCTRTASVKAADDVKIWALERKVFQAIMVKTGLERQSERLEFLKSVKDLDNVSFDKLAKIADLLEVDYFTEGQYIVREGEVGDNFYIISDGCVRVVQKIQGQIEPGEVRRLKRGDYFGEKALLTNDRRTASVIATKPGVELLSINREAFTNLIGDLAVVRDRDYGDKQRHAEWKNAAVEMDDVIFDLGIEELSVQIDPQYKDIQLKDLQIVATLGIGGFGRVELVQMSKDKQQTFALKCLKKQHIVDTRQQEHVYNEKRIMLSCRSPYIVRLYKTFRDRKFLYMLMEPCLGGELWTILRDCGHFDDTVSRFVVACVIKALQYLHCRNIIYRDLKPENLLVTPDGYVKLVDFGFSKCLTAGRKTWTFCGTPEYVAPEIILNKGHDHAVDIWALGILIFELSTGLPPFTASEPMKTYNIILRGIDAMEMPKKVSRNAQNMLKRLCRLNPAERLGCQRNGMSDIMKHKWFAGFDWAGLENRDIQTPFKRKVLSATDVTNFDKYPNEVIMPPDELSGWDENF